LGPAHHLVGVIQARMASTRLPGKVLADLGGRPVLAWVIEGARRALDDVVVAHTRAPEDAAIAACARACGVATFAGSTDNVLDRVCQAARQRSATDVVRLTADCPLLDPAIVEAVLAQHIASGADLTTNDAAVGGHPRGFDVAVIDMAALERARRLADRPHQSEHVTPFLLEHSEHYRIKVVAAPAELRRPHYRLCVDTADDLRLCREVVARLARRPNGGLGPARPTAAEIIALLDDDPALAAINAQVSQAPVEATRA